MKPRLRCTTPMSLGIAFMGHALIDGLGCTFTMYSPGRQQLILHDRRGHDSTELTISRIATPSPSFQYEIGSASSPALRRRVTRLLRAFVCETQAPLTSTLAIQAA